MAKLRNISEDSLTVPLLGGQLVEPDTVIEVPDDVFKAHAWAESVWAVVTTSKKTEKEN